MTGASPVDAQQNISISGENPNYLFDLGSVGAPLGKSLASYGIYVHGAMQQSDVSVLAGGHHSASQYVNLSYWGFDVDTEKAFGLQGGLFDMTFSDQLGNTASASNGVGSNAFVPYSFSNAARLVNFYYNQSWFNHDLQVTIGRMQSGYTSTPYLSPGIHQTEWYCTFFSTSCGATNAFASNSSKAPYEVGSWGAKVTVHPAPNWYVMTGAYENQPLEVTTTNHLGWPGPDWSFDESKGVFLPVQLGYVTSPATSLYPTNFHIGGYYDTAKFPDKFLNANLQPIASHPGAPLMDNSAYGLFMGLQQTVYRPSADPRSTRGLSLFFTGDWDLSHKGAISQQYNAGFVFTGPFAERSADTLNFLASVAFYDQGLILGREGIAAVHGINYTMKPQIGFELNYGFVPTPGMTIYPFTQYVIHPDQLGLAIPDPNDKYAFTFGVRAVIRFDTVFGLPRVGS